MNTENKAENAIKDYPITPVPFTSFQVNDDFWSPRLKINRDVTLPYDFKKCEETGRIDNFAIAGKLKDGSFQGLRFNDSDVFKVMEGAAYSLSLQPDPELEKYLDDLIDTVATAQEDDGYLFTTRTIDPNNLAIDTGDTRWSYLEKSHELYNVGHMYEAAVAYYQATGKRKFLAVALNNANLIDRVFGPDKIRDVPGHQEIEIGLAKLYRVTGEEKYLNLAKFFLNERGNDQVRNTYGDYCQDHKPVIEQEEANGHAVRAVYMYSAMTDVAALTADDDYIQAVDRIWDNVISKKIYLTGGIGSRHEGEAFGDNFELPNGTAYNETCAAIGNAMWNHRLFLLHGEAKYIDILERIIYNGFLSGISLSGDHFFYPNPLEWDGKFAFNIKTSSRQPWFHCSCCPTNVVRFLPSLPGYLYAQENNAIFINLYIANSATIQLAEHRVSLKQETNYPWDGKVSLIVDTDAKSEFEIRFRIPGWTQNRPVPSDLYQYSDENEDKVTLNVNGSPVPLNIDKGYACLNRIWEKGDTIELNLPMPIRRVLCDENVESNRGRIALERGPVVYCAEGVDNGGKTLDLILPDSATLKCEQRSDILNGLRVIRVIDEDREITLIPYHAWAHRGEGEMAVWLKRG